VTYRSPGPFTRGLSAGVATVRLRRSGVVLVTCNSTTLFRGTSRMPSLTLLCVLPWGSETVAVTLLIAAARTPLQYAPVTIRRRPQIGS